MGLPLQADLRPAPYWYRRLLILSACCIAILTLGFFQIQKQKPIATADTQQHTQLLGNEKHLYLKTIDTHIQQAKQRIWCMLYVMRRGDNLKHPVNYLSALLVKAKQRGVDVRIILDQSDPEGTYPGPDNSDSVAYFRLHGIPVFVDELERTSHSKALLIDNHCIVGSHNWTSWALTKNRELSILSYEPDTVKALEQEFSSIPSFQ